MEKSNIIFKTILKIILFNIKFFKSKFNQKIIFKTTNNF